MEKSNPLSKITSLCGALLLFVALAGSAQAADSVEMRSQCFTDLKSNLAETGMFASEVSTNLDDMNYEELQALFSDYYGALSSFGIDIDEPLFEWRIYSFGEQTGYVHPPYSPFPASTKADTWADPAKQYVVLEEYITDESGERNFVSCGLIQIDGEDLMEITGDNYLYDGENLSAVKKTDDYTAWYNANLSFDYEQMPFAYWTRMFIYPQESQNDYFNRYDLTNAISANEVSNFYELVFGYGATEEDYQAAKVLDDQFGEIAQRYENGELTEDEFTAALDELYAGEGATDDSLSVVELDQNGQFITDPEAENTSPLNPVQTSEKDSIFGMNSYYEAIEARFPAFAKHLALQGLVPYETVKQVLADPNNEDYEVLWGTILDPRATIQYSRAKRDGEITEENQNLYYEEALEKIAVLSQSPENIKPENLLTNNLTDEEKAEFDRIILEQESTETSSPITWEQIALLIALVILIPIVVFTSFRRK